LICDLSFGALLADKTFDDNRLRVAARELDPSVSTLWASFGHPRKDIRNFDR
jgi:hypothetical protein